MKTIMFLCALLAAVSGNSAESFKKAEKRKKHDMSDDPVREVGGTNYYVVNLVRARRTGLQTGWMMRTLRFENVVGDDVHAYDLNSKRWVILRGFPDPDRVPSRETIAVIAIANGTERVHFEKTTEVFEVWEYGRPVPPEELSGRVTPPEKRASAPTTVQPPPASQAPGSSEAAPPENARAGRRPSRRPATRTSDSLPPSSEGASPAKP